jgi:YfiH family protein
MTHHALPESIVPEWDADPRIGALMTTRAGGVSAPPWDSLNLGLGSGDVRDHVLANRARVAAATGARHVYVRQVHGAQVARLGARDALPGAPVHRADASVTTEPGIACAVQVADCLPVLFAAPGGVAAAHAGWRGLAAGVLENTLAALCEAARCVPSEVQAWMGACIGPRRFEVGADVLVAFRAPQDGTDPARFAPAGPGRWLANLPQLARDRLQRGGVRTIGGGRWCTFDDPSRFFSYRRDRSTGRMAAAVWLRG